MKKNGNVDLFKNKGFILGLVFLLALSARGQQSNPPSPDVNQQLLSRIEELEAKVKQLEEKQAGAASTAATSPAQAPAAPVAAPAQTAAVVPPPEPAPEPPAVNEVAPRLKMILFGDVGLQGYNGSPTTFYFGSFDIFMTARLSDKISALGEVLFLSESPDNTINLDVERLLLTYRANDYFKASIGRFHTWVGYYNSAFNKGEFLETSIDRPFIYAFDDFGGVLPMQDVGVTATGKIPSGKLGLNWVAEVSNGRAWGVNVQPAQNRQDLNGSKAINGGLFIRPDWLSGLQAGFSVRHDNLSLPGPAVHETIATAHAVFIDSNYEILNEAVLDRHTLDSGTVFDTAAGYTQWSRRFKRYRPFFRFQFFNAPTNDPVFAYAPLNEYAPYYFTGFVSRLDGPSAGIRYDFNEHAAFKFQYDRFFLRNLPSENGLTTQMAFTF